MHRPCLLSSIPRRSFCVGAAYILPTVRDSVQHRNRASSRDSTVPWSDFIGWREPGEDDQPFLAPRRHWDYPVPSMTVLITDQEPVQPKKDFLSAVTPWVETMSKGVAGVVIVVYVCGFLIAAGMWYLFFVSIPVSIATGYRSVPWRRIGKNSPGLWLFCYSTSIVIDLLFNSTSVSVTSMPVWAFVTLGVVWLLLIVATRSSKIPEWVAVIVAVLLTAVYLVNPVRTLLFEHGFDTSSVALWFFVTTLLTIIEFQIRTKEDLITDGGWSKPMAVVFALLLMFAQYYYPHLKASWGGGTPADVTVYFTKNSSIDPGKWVQAQLIEESDDGFYIVGPKESKAVFVPRSMVALIYFGDKIGDSSLLQGSK